MDPGRAILRLSGATVDLEHRWAVIGGSAGSIEADAGGTRVRLTTLEVELLRYLAERTDRVVPRDELLANVWHHAPTVVSRACDNAIRRLRTKIEVDPSEPESLLTQFGSGYRLLLADARPAAPVVAPPVAPAEDAVTRRFTLADRVVDLDRARVEGPDGAAALTHNELELLTALYDTGGLPLDRDRLMRRIWGSSGGRALENTVSRLRRKIEPDPARPAWLLTTAHGYRLELGGAPVSVPEASADAVLPGEPDPLFGRKAEISAIAARLDAGDRLITLVGPGGVGKTRLAVAAVRAWAERNQASAWFVDLSDLRGTEASATSGLRGVDRFVAAIARTVRVVLGRDESIGQLGRALAGRGRAVLVLDNLEQLDPSTSLVIAMLLESAPALTVVGTSRVALRARGERRIEVDRLSTDAGVALFVDRAVRPPDVGELPLIASLVDALDGLPLAIELAAARTAVLSVAELYRRMGDHRRLLATAGTDRPERHRSLRACLDASWDLLAPWSRAALAQLSVFDGGLTLDAAEAVLSLDAWPEASWTIDVLQDLVDASLVRVDPVEARYHLLRSVRDHAAEHLAPAGGADTPADRHARHYAAHYGPAALSGLDGPGEVELRTALGRDLDNLLNACAHAVDRRWGDVAVDLVCAVCEMLELTGPFDTALAACDQVSALPMPPATRARLLLVSGRARVAVGDWDEALDDLTAAAGLDREAGDGRIEARAGLERARIELQRGRLPVALGAAEQALAIATRLGDEVLRCRALEGLAAVLIEQWSRQRSLESAESAVRLATGLGARRLGAVARMRLGVVCDRVEGFGGGRPGGPATPEGMGPRRARRELESALAVARELGDLRLEAQVLVCLGGIDRLSGNLAESRRALEAARELHRRIGDTRGETDALIELGGTSAYFLDLADAGDLFGEARARATRLGARALLCRATLGLANTRAMAQSYAEAGQLYREALALSREIGDPRSEATALTNHAKLMRDEGDLSSAATLYEAGLAIHRRIGNRRSTGVTMSHLADLLEEEGKLRDAVDTYDAAIAIHREVGNRRFEAIGLHNLGRTYVLLGDWEPAERRVDEALALFRELGDPVWTGRALLTRAELELGRGRPDAARQAVVDAEAAATPAQLAPRLDDLRTAAFEGGPLPTPTWQTR